MRNLAIIILLVCFFPMALLGATPGKRASDSRDEALDAAIINLMDQYYIPGAAVASFYRDPCDPGVVVLHHMGTYGFAKIEESIPVEEWTTFCVASVSKIVSSTSLLQAWEDHGFSLDDEVDDFLSFPVVHPTCPDSAVTFRKVQTHTASLITNMNGIGAPAGTPICEGLADYFSPDGQYYNPDSWEPMCPGRAYVYSNIGPTLLACAAGEIGGMPFPEYSQVRLFDPLGMDDTAWFGDAVDQESVAYSYSWREGVGYTLISAGGRDMFVYPAWSLRTSIVDLSRFAMAYMMDGELDGIRILDEATIDEAWTVQYATSDIEMGLVWQHMYSSSTGQWYWGHGGSDSHYLSMVMIQEDHEFGLVMMCNGGGPDYLTGALSIVGATIANVQDITLAAPPMARPRVEVGPNVPNPCNPSTRIHYVVLAEGPARLRIFDLRGRHVATLMDGIVAAGHHEVEWDGRDSSGGDVPSGVYLSRFEAGGQAAHGRMTLVR